VKKDESPFRSEQDTHTHTETKTAELAARKLGPIYTALQSASSSGKDLTPKKCQKTEMRARIDEEKGTNHPRSPGETYPAHKQMKQQRKQPPNEGRTTQPNTDLRWP
jgi:hypothetical protein